MGATEGVHFQTFKITSNTGATDTAWSLALSGASSRTIWIEVTATMRGTSSGLSGARKVVGCVKWTGSTHTFVGSQQVASMNDSLMIGAVAIDVDPTGATIRVRVTASNETTMFAGEIKWQVQN